MPRHSGQGIWLHSDGAAVLGQRHLQVRSANVVAGRYGHGTSAGFPQAAPCYTRGRAEGKRAMDVIPVIDVRHGVAVAAVRGRRADYRPLVTPLAAGSDPADIARGYAALFTFPLLYVADLDGIEGRGRNAGLAGELARAVPNARLWIDDGTPAREAAQRIARRTERDARHRHRESRRRRRRRCAPRRCRATATCSRSISRAIACMAPRWCSMRRSIGRGPSSS